MLYTQSILQSCWGGGGGWWMMDDATAATGQRRQCVHHTPDTGGLLGGHDWQESVEGIWPGHRGYTLTLYEKCHWIFNDHRESGPRFNVSSERQCLLTVKCPRHTQTTGWAQYSQYKYKKHCQFWLNLFSACHCCLVPEYDRSEQSPKLNILMTLQQKQHLRIPLMHIHRSCWTCDKRLPAGRMVSPDSRGRHSGN